MGGGSDREPDAGEKKSYPLLILQVGEIGGRSSKQRERRKPEGRKPGLLQGFLEEGGWRLRGGAVAGEETCPLRLLKTAQLLEYMELRLKRDTSCRERICHSTSCLDTGEPTPTGTSPLEGN